MFSAPADVVVPPLAVSDRVVVGFDAFELKETFPVTEPIACGLNVIVRGRLLPGVIVMGNWLAGTPNSELSTEAAETIKFPPEACPVFDIWTVLVTVVPVWTVPKSYGEGKTVRMGAATVFEPDGSKSAPTVCEPFIVTVQVAVPEHAPDQPANVEEVAVNAVRVTEVFVLKFAAH
jgi:hypothetical protein